MSMHQTKDSGRRISSLFGTLSSWRPVFLAALIPLAAACTDTVTGLDGISHEEEESTVDQRPRDRDIPVAR